ACVAHGLEKIKTIGDAYMAAGGVPKGDGPATPDVVRLALDMIAVVDDIPVQKGTTLQLRIGVHEGPVVAGVIGRRKFIYDLWGDTVNTAARMESHGIPGRVQVSEGVAQQLDDGFELENRGMIEVKGKGAMAAYLVGRPDTTR
ncbi:MAG: adenylate/guanylate cyclase domain-containing protein, partial [Myxococcota bacterium]|nr:adenylate/guanylate cyclase domain-containing protein [Myxococcota bacterium]